MSDYTFDRTISANDLDFACLEAGPADGPLVILVHGFPDTAHAWKPTLAVLAEAGFHAVAPNVRGYSPSAAPADKDYGGIRLAEDVLGWMDALGAKDAIVVGHDVGAMAAYGAASLAPERVTKLVTIAIPHLRSLRFGLKALAKASHFLTLQLPGAAGRLVRNDFAGMRAIYRKWSPAWQVSEEELAPAFACFAADASGPVGFYHSFRKGAGAKGKPDRKRLLKRTVVPSMCFLGEADGALALDPSDFERTRKYYESDYEIVSMPGAGHFPHREYPDLFHERLLAFIGPA